MAEEYHCSLAAQLIFAFRHYTLDIHDPKPNEYDLVKRSEKRLPQIIKILYEESDEVANLPQNEVYRLRDGIILMRIENAVRRDSFYIPNPVQTCEQAFGNFPEILNTMTNIRRIFPIQSSSWPILLSGQDLLSIVNTRVGKTLSYLLPALVHIDSQPTSLRKRGGPNVLVLAPTRESVEYIKREFDKYLIKNFKSSCLYSGIHTDEQLKKIKRGVQIVIATPCKLYDLMEVIPIEAITFIVFDDADKMLDMGFGRAIRKSLRNASPHIQAVVTSSTLQYPVQLLCQNFLKNFVQLVMANIDLSAVRPIVYECIFLKTGEVYEKLDLLVKHITELKPDEKTLIYTKYRKTAFIISADLHQRDIKCQSIYFNIDKSERDQALEDMASGKINVLITTDSESPHIDIDGLKSVISFELPMYMNYMSGRVGRIGSPGRAGYSQVYVSPHDSAQAIDLIDVLLDVNQEIPAQLSQMAKNHKRRMYLNKKRETQRREKWDQGNYGDIAPEGQYNEDQYCREQDSEEEYRDRSEGFKGKRGNMKRGGNKGSGRCQSRRERW